MALLVSLVGISSSKFQAGVVVYRLALSNEKSGFESYWYPLFLQPLESLIAIVLKKISIIAFKKLRLKKTVRRKILEDYKFQNEFFILNF